MYMKYKQYVYSLHIAFQGGLKEDKKEGKKEKREQKEKREKETKNSVQ